MYNIIRTLFPTARRLLVDKDINDLPTSDGMRVLVVGAGKDPYRKHFSRAQTYISTDITYTKGAIDIVANAVELPFANNTFDRVVAIELMEHLTDPIQLFGEAFRVLAPGGSLYLSVPFAFHQHADPSDFWRPTYHALKLLTGSFSDVSVYSQGNRLHVISDLITTAFYPVKLFWPLRILNHIFVLPFRTYSYLGNKVTAPSGFFVIATK